MNNEYNGWESYKVVKHETMGRAYFQCNKEAQMWQQVTKWYFRLGNLRNHVLAKFGHHF